MSLACAQVAGTMLYVPDMATADAETIDRAEYLADGSKLIGDPYAWIAKAATGDIEAMRNTADAILLYILGKGDPTPVATLREGLVFARMAASRGDTDDIRRLIYLLAYAGIICPAEELELFAPEMIALVEIMADRGDEACATLLASVAEHETAETMAGAQQMKARILASWTLDGNRGVS